ncbi:MAG: DUF1697 domain-containing protein [Firmicutes bacterium]|nr:DUF1697 domain-containing protein [Bacillota bacterium]
MTIYIALLRGINVGGKNKIKMTDLKRMFEAIGLSRVETYIQSGNVLFESSEKEDILRKKIENEIETIFGFSVVVVLRTAAELEQIIRHCPFSEEEVTEAELSNSEGESLYVSLLTQAPSPEKTERLNAFRSEGDEYRIKNRDMYLLFRHSIRNSKLANNLQKLDVPATTRNWKKINKLYALAKARTDS